MIQAAKSTVPGARERILAAASEISRQNGAANLSLDAVAERANVSKGGLLYHFPTKAALMRASVETFLAEFDEELERTREAEGNGLLAAYVDLAIRETEKIGCDAAGVLAAIVDDPHFLEPIRDYHRVLLDRLLKDSGDPENVLLIYLAIEGLRSMCMFDLRILKPGELATAVAAARTLAKANPVTA